jgi:hypothetical protein
MLGPSMMFAGAPLALGCSISALRRALTDGLAIAAVILSGLACTGVMVLLAGIFLLA